MHEKKRNLALDPVANFHIRNGASVYRILWMGDVSEKGMNRSFGLMVNYMYVLDEVERNNYRYLKDGTISIVSRKNVIDESVAMAQRWIRENGGVIRVVEKSM